MNKKPAFVITVDNTIDIITNSSSELFVLHGQTKKHVIEMVKKVYPEYLKEYAEIVNIKDIDRRDLETYLDYEYSDRKNKIILAEKFNVPPHIMYTNFHEIDKEDWWYGNISDEGLEAIKEQLPTDMFFLFSLDENPNWDMQERLMNIGERYHLG